jgi:hypothetical protein
MGRLVAITDPPRLSGCTLAAGGMAERTNARLLKSLGPKGSWVRIPLPPRLSELQHRPRSGTKLDVGSLLGRLDTSSKFGSDRLMFGAARAGQLSSWLASHWG